MMVTAQQNMTPAEILSLFRQRPLYGLGFLLFVGVCIGVLVYFFRPTPATQPPAIVDLLGRPTQLQDISFAGALPNIPSSLKVYEGGSSPVIPSSYAEILVSNMGMTPLDNIAQNIWVDSALGASLQLLPNNTFSYGAKRNATKDLPPLSDAQLTNSSKSFVADILLLGNSQEGVATTYTPLLQEVEFLSEAHEGGESVSRANADTYLVPLTLLLDEVPVRYGESRKHLVEVWLDRSETVIKATFPPPLPSPVELQNAPTISSDQIIESIKNGLVETLHLYGGENPITVDELLSYSITKLEIEYRYIPETNVFFPYFFLTGEAKSKDGRIGNLGLLVPAVSTTPPEAPTQR
jgi:hypothetical protein